MYVAVTTPTRGIVITEALNSVRRNLKEVERLYGAKTDMFFTWDKTLPHGHNDAVQEAMNDGATLIWMVEEDVIVPDGTLRKMIEADKDYIAVDYPEKSEFARSYIARYPVNDPECEIYWTHTGCTLIKRHVFEKIPYPWFENHYFYEIEPRYGMVSFRQIDYECPYGGHDLNFGVKMRDAGMVLSELKGVSCTHCQVVLNKKPTTNTGLHEIKKYTKIKTGSAIHDIIEDRLARGEHITDEDVALAFPPSLSD